MLEGVAIVADVVVVVVGIGEEVIACSKYIGSRYVGGRQHGFARLLDDEEVFRVVGQILAQLIAQVGVGVAVANNLDGIVGTYRTMIGSDDDAIVFLCQLAEQVGNDRMAEP